MSKTYRSKVMASVHETAADLHQAGLLNDDSMREFDEGCLTETTRLSPSEIRSIRLQAKVTQDVLAHYLNVSPGLVQEWEAGESQPEGASLKLLLIVRSKGLDAVA